MIIAINDDGMDVNHPDFLGRLEPELNFPSDWESLLESGQFGGHGTSVGGVAAASRDNLMGGAGACPDCRVLPHLLALVDIQGSFMISDSETAQGFNRQIDAGAWVINNSWGLGLGDPIHADSEQGSPNIPFIIRTTYDRAETEGRGGLGTVIVFAAGNDNTGTDYHANHPTTVTVSAIGDVGLKSYYSSFSGVVDVGTPSNGALTGITTTAANGEYSANFGGTSSAAPLATGIIGLIMSANPALTAAEVRDILRDSATKIDPVFGAYDTDGRSDFYGAGMANAYVAVRMAEGTCSDPSECQAPSDDCGMFCDTRELCEPCRTQADCATDYVCQALPSIGRQVCVFEKGGNNCPTGSSDVNGYCLPSAETCGDCLNDEACNGRDDDCDGEVDEDNICGGPPLCFIDTECPESTVCAARSCVPECTTDEECEDGAACRTVKDQYGGFGTTKGCVTDNNAEGCQLGCSVLVSSLPDDELDAFNMCMMNGLVTCNEAFPCAQLLPIQM